MKLISVLFFTLFVCTALNLIAQDKTAVKFGKVAPQDFELPASTAIDSNTNAVIISDLGITDFKGNSKGWFSYIFKRKTRIKILNKKAFDLATVKIRLYTRDDDKESVSDISAVTYNLENGAVKETKLEKNDLFTVKVDKNHIEQKFTMPAVKEGAIIEYAYTINSDFIFNIPPWDFQSIECPVLWSEYQVTIPGLLVYIFNRRGIHSFFIDKADEGHAAYQVIQSRESGGLAQAEERRLTVNANTVKRRWVMKDIPAFYVENYLSSPVNYIDKIEFQLHQTYDGETTHDVMNTWKKVTEELIKDKDFGSFMSGEENNFWLDKALDGIIKEHTGQLQQARDIYYYISDNFTCTSHYNKYITTSLQDVFKKRSGNVGELNLLLTAMLQKKQITASPVLLSTREFGFNYPEYPVMDRLNYVICQTEIDGKIYYLDASYPNLGFSRLPGNCYNGHARIISRTDSASVYFMADSIKEQKLTAVFITNDEKGGLTGTFSSQLGYYESFNLRDQLKGNEKEYFKNIKAGYSFDIAVTEAAIDSLKQPDMPARIRYEFSFKPAPEDDIIYFNPMLTEGYRQNPFKAAERKYPVEMPYTTDETYILNMEIPKGYMAEEIPKPAKVLFNENEGFFEYLIKESGDVIQLRSHIKLNKALFTAEDYSGLRDFFTFVVKKQGEQIVFKRKK